MKYAVAPIVAVVFCGISMVCEPGTWESNVCMVGMVGAVLWSIWLFWRQHVGFKKAMALRKVLNDRLVAGDDWELAWRTAYGDKTPQEVYESLRKL